MGRHALLQGSSGPGDGAHVSCTSCTGRRSLCRCSASRPRSVAVFCSSHRNLTHDLISSSSVQGAVLNLSSPLVCVLVAQSFLTVCDPTDWTPPAFSVHGILQARILEWVAIPFSRGSSQHTGIELRSLALQAASLPSEPPVKPLLSCYP